MYKQIVQIVLEGPEEDVELAINHVEEKLSELLEELQEDGTDITYSVSITDDPDDLDFEDI